jgi:excinuclease ABC subunit C
VRLECPRWPGVYGMVDRRGELIYVGKAKSLRARLLGYFRPRSRDPKAGRIITETRLLAWEPAPTEFSALLRELELIRRWQPRFNIQGQPKRKRRALVCLGRRPAPYAFLSRRAAASVVAVYGPVPAGHQAREAVRRLNDHFRLRDCPQSQEMVFSDQQELFPVLRAAGCLRHEIGTCLGPCAAACSHAEYEARLDAARHFLDGADVGILERLERDMLAASAATQFERAAVLRDRLEPLGWLHACLERLRRARGLSFVYPLRSCEGQELWYVIRGGQVEAVLPAGAEAAATVAAVYASKAAGPGSWAAKSVDGLLLVDAWFRKHPEEKARTLTPEQALAACAASGQIHQLPP